MYNDTIIENFTNPHNTGEIDSCDYEYEIGNPVCGDRIRVQLEMNGEHIEKAVFRAWGCATSIATANIFCTSIMHTPFNEIAHRDEQAMKRMLGELEPSQQHCLHILEGLHQELLKITAEGVA